MGVQITLITFEKPADLLNASRMAELRAIFKDAGILWRALRYHKRPKWPATAFDSVQAIWTCIRLNWRQRFDIVHARTFVSGPSGFLISRLLAIPFIYHNEGFYPDEQVDGGVWVENSLPHRLARRIEGFLYDHADAIVVLSEQARKAVLSRSTTRLGTQVIVVPSAVALEAFQLAPSRKPRAESLSLVYLGSVGLRYRLDEAGRFVKAVRRHRPGTMLSVVSRADRRLVESMLDSSGLERDAWILKELAHSDVPAELRRHQAGLFFLTQGLSEHGCSPTKIGEYWATGLPVVTSPNVSDTDAMIRAHQVGVIVNGKDEAALDAAALELIELLGDSKLAPRCRQAAEALYGLDAACVLQKELYESLVRAGGPAEQRRTSPQE